MNKWIITLFVGMGMLLLFSGCTIQPKTDAQMKVKQESKAVVQKIDRENIKKIHSRREIYISK